MASHRRRKTPRPPRRHTRVDRTQLALLWVSIALLVVAIVTLLVMVLAWRFPVPQQVIVRVETSASSPCDGRTLRPRDAVSKPRQVDSAPLGASQRQVSVHVMTARRSDFTSRPVAVREQGTPARASEARRPAVDAHRVCRERHSLRISLTGFEPTLRWR
jgi:hypothetical protein